MRPGDLPKTQRLTLLCSAARVDLAQFAAFAIEEHLALTTDLYREAVLGIGKDLSSGIKGLTSVMEYFSRNGHVENLPLSVYVTPCPLCRVHVHSAVLESTKSY